MRRKASPPEISSERHVRDIRRDARKQCSAEDKTGVVLDGLLGEASIAGRVWLMPGVSSG